MKLTQTITQPQFPFTHQRQQQALSQTPKFPYRQAPSIVQFDEPENTHENSGVLTQKFENLQNNVKVVAAQKKFQNDEEVAFQRYQKRKEENQRRFQEMMLNNFKQ